MVTTYCHGYVVSPWLLDSILFVCSPYQDDFFVIHVKDDFDSVLESVLKTEFLTLLSEKFKTLTNHHMTFAFSRRYVCRSHDHHMTIT